MAILTALFGGLTAIGKLSDVVSTLTNRIADAKIAAINAGTEKERIVAQERVKGLEAERDVMLKAIEAKAGVQTAEAGISKANIFMRTFLAAPVGIVLWKVFVFDKALGQWTGGRTDALSVELWQVVMVVLGFYFLYELGVGASRLFARR